MLKKWVFSKGVNPRFGAKIENFEIICFGARKKVYRKCFVYLLYRKESYLNYRLKLSIFLWSKNWHFVMGLTHDFGKKLESFKFVLLG